MAPDEYMGCKESGRCMAPDEYMGCMEKRGYMTAGDAAWRPERWRLTAGCARCPAPPARPAAREARRVGRPHRNEPPTAPRGKNNSQKIKTCGCVSFYMFYKLSCHRAQHPVAHDKCSSRVACSPQVPCGHAPAPPGAPAACSATPRGGRTWEGREVGAHTPCMHVPTL